MAQIDLNDQNWHRVFDDEFDNHQTWNPNTWISLPDGKWKAHPGKRITHDPYHQVYQYDHCLFDVANGKMRLLAEYDPEAIQYHDYVLPDTMHGHYPNAYGQNDGLFYFSGEIETTTKFRYGYFEIRCKLPVHRGAFPSFWLHATSDTIGNSYYASLDIFEYGWHITRPDIYPDSPEIGYKKRYTCALHYNDTACVYDTNDIYNKAIFNLPSGSTGLDNYHKFSCEWMPDHVIWYFDGIEMNRCDNPNHIPRRSLTMKVNYGIDNYYNYDSIIHGIWEGSDEMLIDYIRIYQLDWDCSTDETITCQSDLDGFDYAVKKSVSITSTIDAPVVGSGDNVTFRVADSFEVTGPFTVSNGAEFTVIQQLCPSDE